MGIIQFARAVASFLGIACLIVLAAPQPVRAHMNDAALFPAPHSRCMQASKGRLLTSVGHLGVSGGEDFELVADTRLKPVPNGLTEFEDPSLSVFDRSCELVWYQSFPELAEVGFRVLGFPGMPMLHVSAISVFRPVDQIISDEELLAPAGRSLSGVISFGGDRYGSSYVGPLGPDGGFGVVTTDNGGPRWVGGQLLTPVVTALVYRWQAIADPAGGPPGHLFIGPEMLVQRP
jgi:hypothetical protein